MKTFLFFFAVASHIPYLFHLVSLLVSTGPPTIRASIHGLVINIIQSLCTCTCIKFSGESSWIWYRKIPKISPSMYKPLQIQAPQTGNAKNPPLNRPSKYKPPGGLYLEISLKYKVKQSKTVIFLPTIRLAQSILKRKFPSVDKPLRI